MNCKESTEKWQSCLLSRVCCCHYEALPDLNTDSYPFIFHLHIHIQMDSLNPQHLILTCFCYYALNKSQTRLRIFAPFFFKFTGEFTQVKADAKLLFTPKSEEKPKALSNQTVYEGKSHQCNVEWCSFNVVTNSDCRSNLDFEQTGYGMKSGRVVPPQIN